MPPELRVDAAGNALVTGSTSSSDLAGANNTYHGSGDAFVAKVTSTGTLAWATYLGGSSSPAFLAATTAGALPSTLEETPS